MMKQMKAARIPICVVPIMVALVIAAMMLSSSVVYACSGGGAGNGNVKYDEKGYSVILPACWNGHVMVNEPDAYGTTFEVRSKKYPNRVLCAIRVISSNERITGGDIGNPAIKQVRLSDGRVACVRAANYSWIVTSNSLNLPHSEAAELVSLTTGGKTIAYCERASKLGNDMLSANWIADNVKVIAQ